ncbi:ABC transporter permease [Candidatus Puniceispirillum sp.]|nr:ABC transporter permease [Candidatus Puniceispirillum sp.]
MIRVLRIAAVTGVILLLWHMLVVMTGLPAFILPSPMRVATALFSNLELIGHHATVTIAEVLIGLCLGAVLGVVTAISLALSPVSRLVVRPMMVISQALPVFALAPVLTLWLGYGLWPKIIMALLIIYFPVTSAFFDGLMQTPRGMLDMANVMQGKSWQIMRYIRIPSAIPALASGLRLAAVYAPIGAIIGEWVGASQGLGYLMLLANGRAKIDLMFAALIVLALLTLLLHGSVDRLCSYVVKRQQT